MRSRGEIDQSKMTPKSLVSETLLRPLKVTVTEPIAIALNLYLVSLLSKCDLGHGGAQDHHLAPSLLAMRCSIPGVRIPLRYVVVIVLCTDDTHLCCPVESFPLVYEDMYGFGIGIGGLPYLAIVLGSAIASLGYCAWI